MTMAFMILLTMLLLAQNKPMTGAPTADLILINGNFYTLDDAAPRAEAIAARGDRIVYVGPNDGALAFKGATTREIDLGGATVVPGLIDAHGHMAGLGLLAGRLDLVGTGSSDEVAGMVARKSATLKPGQWILGRGWDQNDWKNESFPTSRVLDAAAPDNPVSLSRVDGHATWVNTRAMRLAGVSKETPDPPGGRIVRDASGEPTGILIDRAGDLVEAKIPEPTREETREALQVAMRRCLAAGLTGVHDAGVGPVELELYHELLVKDGFPFRVYAMLAGESAPVEGRVVSGWLERQLANGPAVGLGAGRLTVRSVKLYADGALGSRGAALLSPYLDDPNNTGLLRMEPAALRAMAQSAGRSGFQVCIHAIGDRGNRLALDAIEAARKAAGRAAGTDDLRHRIEHAQVLSPLDIPRFAALGVLASIQPTHATSDMYWAADRIGAERLQGAYAWRTLLSSGARLACGSDFPVESENPLLGFYAAVTRQDAKGWPSGGWLPDQRLTREEALRCFTLDAAYAAFEEKQRGSVVTGKLADLTVLSQDIMKVPPLEILRTTATMTIVGGRVAYEKR